MSKEHTAAANALIQRFNSQEISRVDARRVMVKVLAKMLVDTPEDTIKMREQYDTFASELANACNDQAIHVLHRRGRK